MELQNKSTRLWSRLLRLDMPQVRAFHMAWFAFFLCFFAWFGMAPLMPVVREEFGLSQSQIGWCIIASVAATVFARLLAGWLCDRIGPRLTYTYLLVLGSLPVMGIGLAQSFESFLLFRLLIGAIGAGFVITQYHTSVMFAPNCVGAANATTAGWGNLGGGVTQFAMPLLLALLVGWLGLSEQVGWRVCMLVAGVACLLTGLAYYRWTQDAPEGNYKQLRAVGKLSGGHKASAAYLAAWKDSRVWVLFAIYGACFGVELTIHNIAALYFVDYFGLSLMAAGFAAAGYGMMNLFARTLGGLIGDRFGQRWGLQGRVGWLFLAVFCEGLALMFFSQMRLLALAIPALIVFAVLVQMSNGATYAVVPLINKKALGAVAGIVGAGGNVGAMAAGLLFQGGVAWPTALLILGALVTAISFLTFLVRLPRPDEAQADAQLEPETGHLQQPAGRLDPAWS